MGEHVHKMDGNYWPAKCSECGYVNRLPTREEFRATFGIKSPAPEVFECDYCLFESEDEQGYNRHMLEVHQEAETEGWTLPGYDEQDFHDVRDWD